MDIATSGYIHNFSDYDDHYEGSWAEEDKPISEGEQSSGVCKDVAKMRAEVTPSMYDTSPKVKFSALSLSGLAIWAFSAKELGTEKCVD